jgi:signal transduction histidine kinase
MIRRLLCSTLIVLLAAAAAARVDAQGQSPSRRSGQLAILVLAVDDETRPWVRLVRDGFTEAVLEAADPPELYFETLDAARFTADDYLEAFRDWLTRKYHDRRVDLVVPLFEDALYFLEAARGQPWPDAAVLYIEAGGLTHDVSERLPQATGVLMEPYVKPTLTVIKQILPDTERIAFVYGSSNVERMRYDGLADVMRGANLGLDPLVLAGLSMDDLLARIAHLPERTIVLGIPQTEPAGRFLPPRETCARMSAATNRPLFSVTLDHLGCGVVGGLLKDFTVAGRVLGEQALLRLRGGPGATVTIPLARYGSLVFDERQLQRWSIPESRLPAGSVVQFRQPNLWRDYRAQALTAVAVVSIQSALIAVLFFEHRRRRRAEIESRRHLAVMAHLDRQTAMGELAASLAHELNQPLGAILRNAETAKLLLGSPAPALDDLRDIVEDIRSDDKRAGDVIRRVRTLLRKREIETRPVDVNDVARETLAIVATDAAAKGVRVEVELSAMPCVVMGDSVHLQQVLLNLVLNGMEAMAETPPGRRRLTVRTACHDGDVDVSVADTGTGIRSESASQIFDPFFTTKRDGMGMGLSIACSIVDAHGGRIAAEDNAGGGATVRLSLPVAQGG